MRLTNAYLRQKIHELALADLQFADDELGYTDLAADAMWKKLGRMKAQELRELYDRAKASRYFEAEVENG